MIYLLLGLAFLGEAEVANPVNVWVEIAELEAFLNQSINGEENPFGVFHSDPVRGFYVAQTGVFLIVPLRYRPVPSPLRNDGATLATRVKEPVVLDHAELQKKMRQWREKLKQEELLREADFEKSINQIKDLIPDILTKLPHLLQGERLFLIVEEREPAWYYSTLNLKRDKTRKVVTLTVAQDIIAKIKSQETTLPADWRSRVQRTTTNRRLRSLIP